MSAGGKKVVLELEILRKRLVGNAASSTDPYVNRMLRVFEFLDDGSVATEFFAEILELLAAERARLHAEVVRLSAWEIAPKRTGGPFEDPIEPPGENKSSAGG